MIYIYVSVLGCMYVLSTHEEESCFMTHSMTVVKGAKCIITRRVQVEVRFSVIMDNLHWKTVGPGVCTRSLQCEKYIFWSFYR